MTRVAARRTPVSRCPSLYHVAACAAIVLASAPLPAQGATQGSAQGTAAGVLLALPDTARTGELMPVPKTVEWHGTAVALDSTFLVATPVQHDARLDRALRRFIQRMELRTSFPLAAPYHGNAVGGGTGTVMMVAVDGPGERVQSIHEDESYTLDVTPHDPTGGARRAGTILLHAKTTVGALRGLETVLQLVRGDAAGFSVPTVHIEDAPRFAWRGLLLDVSRHFEPVDEVERTLDGMAAVKLNVLHWHLSDDQGFRVESRRFPKLAGMGSDSLYYTQAQIREVVAYARDRGIRVVPEFDMPGHSTSWFVGYPQYSASQQPYELRRGWSGYGGVFDPTRASVYRFIDSFIGEMTHLFPDAYWHVGGDEVGGAAWTNVPRVARWMQRHHIADPAALQTYFNGRLSKILTRHHRNMVGWDEILHPGLPTQTVIESWRGTSYLADAAAAGHQGILAAPYYLDAMKSAATEYLADPLAVNDSTVLTGAGAAGVLGGEATMWSELVWPETIDSRIWPRLAAIAERFWSPQSARDVPDMYRRLTMESARLEMLGLTHESHTDRMLRQTVQHADWRALTPLTDAVEPATLGQRLHARRTVQMDPLVQFADIVRPDPPLRAALAGYVRAITSGAPESAGAADSLRALFARWATMPAVVSTTSTQSPIVLEAMDAARALAAAGAIGDTALTARTNGAALDSTRILSFSRQLDSLNRAKGTLHIVVVPAIRELLGRP